MLKPRGQAGNEDILTAPLGAALYFPIWEICSAQGTKCSQQELVSGSEFELSAPHKIPHNRGSVPPALIFNNFKQSPLSQGHSTPKENSKGRRKETLFHQVLMKGKDGRDQQEM